MIFTIHAVYYYMIINFGNIAATQTIVWYVYLAGHPLFPMLIVHFYVG